MGNSDSDNQYQDSGSAMSPIFNLSPIFNSNIRNTNSHLQQPPKSCKSDSDSLVTDSSSSTEKKSQKKKCTVVNVTRDMNKCMNASTFPTLQYHLDIIQRPVSFQNYTCGLKAVLMNINRLTENIYQ
jgi:hypothetical protein